MRRSGRAIAGPFPAERPLFYYVTDRSQLPRKSLSALLRRIGEVAAAGAHFVQIREKDLPDLELLRFTADVVSMVRGMGCKVLVNGRFDIALAGDAHGLHLPSKGLFCRDLRPHLPPGFILGASAHSYFEARLAAEGGAHYVLMGPVFPTPSKLHYGAPIGLACLRRVCARSKIPVFGLGGIRPDRIPDVLGAGAAGIAGISLFQNNKDLGFICKWSPNECAD